MRKDGENTSKIQTRKTDKEEKIKIEKQKRGKEENEEKVRETILTGTWPWW